MKKIVLASGNRHKLEEIQAILGGLGFELQTMAEAGYGSDDIIEDGETFEANAMIKARAVHERLGVAALADDSGLEVDALNGAPGVYSARYAGEPKSDSNNNKKLLEALENVDKPNRTARFVTVLTLIMENGDVLVARGEVNGVIGYEPRGNFGFGYDPLFVVPELGRTFAELSPEQKNQLSHRANALAVLKDEIGRYYEGIGHK